MECFYCLKDEYTILLLGACLVLSMLSFFCFSIIPTLFDIHMPMNLNCSFDGRNFFYKIFELPYVPLIERFRCFVLMQCLLANT